MSTAAPTLHTCTCPRGGPDQSSAASCGWSVVSASREDPAAPGAVRCLSHSFEARSADLLGRGSRPRPPGRRNRCSRICGPASGIDAHAFIALYRRLCPTHADEVPVTEFARQLRWSVEETRLVAGLLADRAMIETDAGLGDEITIIEGRSGT
jgi:hypothetical protein